jgi:hypothetical protein
MTTGPSMPSQWAKTLWDPRRAKTKKIAKAPSETKIFLFTFFSFLFWN